MGVINALEPVLQAMVGNMVTKGVTLGKTTSFSDFLELTSSGIGITILKTIINLQISIGKAPERKLGRALDDYIEAQIHSNIHMDSDVEALVADASFKGNIGDNTSA